MPSNSADTTFYFVRHGQTEYNRKGIVQGRKIDSVLNATGRAQARKLARRLAGVSFDALYSSTMRRAVETADALAEPHPETPRFALEDLEEMSWGAYEGQPATDEVLRAFDAIKEKWRAGDFDCAVEGGESVRGVQQRALRALDHIAEKHEGGTVLVVAHGRFLRILIATLLEDYGLERMHEVKHTNTAVNRLVCCGDTYTADLLNCTAHLERAEAVLVE